MGEVKKSIEVEVPVSTAYNQWTQFQEFPEFMENVESVTQLDDTHLRWVAEIGGRREEWKAEITHQEPDSHIAWRSIEGKENAGDVRFDSLGDDRTRIQVVMTWEPEGIVEATAEKIGRDDAAVKADLERFKEMVENRGVESGEWRGQVVEGDRIDS
ncbi:MAG: SRPBCC family protein [Gaiellaceae bacterium]